MTDKPKVLYLAGAHRSGTTLLTSVLGGYEGVFAAGELHEIWENRISGRPCGCGEKLERCPVWGPILREVEERFSPGPLSPRDPVQWRENSARVWHTGRILRQSDGKGRASSESSRYASLMQTLYKVIVRRTGSGVIVDSTKIPSGAALLAAMDGVEPYTVHLVRDPRATAYSWSKPKTKRVSEWEEKLTRIPPFRSGLRWLGYNMLDEWVAPRYGERWRRMRYEDFTSDPRTQVEDLIRWLDVRATSPFKGPDSVWLDGEHVIAGNPDRFDSGTVRIKQDNRWLEGMSRSDRRLVEALGFPLMRRYGYPLGLPRRAG